MESRRRASRMRSGVKLRWRSWRLERDAGLLGQAFGERGGSHGAVAPPVEILLRRGARENPREKEHGLARIAGLGKSWCHRYAGTYLEQQNGREGLPQSCL